MCCPLQKVDIPLEIWLSPFAGFGVETPGVAKNPGVISPADQPDNAANEGAGVVGTSSKRSCFADGLEGASSCIKGEYVAVKSVLGATSKEQNKSIVEINGSHTSPVKERVACKRLLEAVKLHFTHKFFLYGEVNNF